MEFYKNEFIIDTFDAKDFSIFDVGGDNACMYRSIAHGMYIISPNKKKEYILSNKKRGMCKDVNQFGNIIDPNEYLNTELARKIYNLTYEYIIDHDSENIPILGNTTIRDNVLLIHDISWNEYLKEYKMFPADIEEGCYEYDRWGSILEQYIISKLFKIPIVVLTSLIWNDNLNKICNGKICKGKANKNVRLKVLTIIGKEFYKDEKQIIYIIWRNYNKSGHYLCCYPKTSLNIKNVMNIN